MAVPEGVGDGRLQAVPEVLLHRLGRAAGGVRDRAPAQLVRQGMSQVVPAGIDATASTKGIVDANHSTMSMCYKFADC